jgi:PAP2 superfamily
MGKDRQELGQDRNKFLGLIPPINRGQFYASSLLALLMVFFGLWLANTAETWLQSQFDLHRIATIARYTVFDPIVLHLVGYITAIWIIFVISRSERFSTAVSLLTAVVAPALGLVIVAGVMSLLVKPAMGYPRPASFSPEMEPYLIGFLHDHIGHGLGFPSGNVVRQVVLCAAVFALLNHSAAKENISERSRMALRWLNGLLVVLVMTVRPLVGSHSLFDAAGGLAYGIVIFWMFAIPVAALLTEPKGARLVTHFAGIWLAFSLGMLFYSRNPLQWALIAALVCLALAGEAFFLTGYRKRKALARPQLR